MSPFHRSSSDKNLKDITWMSAPLAIDFREKLVERFSTIKNTRFDPKDRKTKIYHNIRHWTLQIGDRCYEIAPVPVNGRSRFGGKFTDFIGGNTCRYEPCDAEEWHIKHKSQDEGPSVKIEYRKVGQTRMSAKQIDAEAKKLWDRFHNNWYGLFTQNCQNFASLLYVAIALKIPADESSYWEDIPDPVSYTLARVSKFCTAGKIVIGSLEIGAAALTFADASAIGGATAMVATDGIGATMAASSTGTTTSTAGAAAAKGGAVGVGKTGIAAKLAAAGHAAGPKIAVAAGKYGLGWMGAGPALGVGAIAATVYFHKQAKKNKAFRAQLMAGQKSRDFDDDDDDDDEEDAEQDRGEFSIEQMLEEEDMLFRDAEKGDVVDEEVEEELAKQLEMTRITTEPGPMADGESKISEGMSGAIDDQRRAQTLGV